jgi:hypothetical protein
MSSTTIKKSADRLADVFLGEKWTHTVHWTCSITQLVLVDFSPTQVSKKNVNCCVFAGAGRLKL